MEKPDLPLYSFTPQLTIALNISSIYTTNQINVMILALIIEHNLENSKGKCIVFTHTFIFIFFLSLKF